MVKVTNVVGEILRPIGTVSEDFKVKGLLLPRDKVSRNGVLYDWDSVKTHAKEFEDVCLNYNHIIDDGKKPIGKIKKTWIKEEDDDAGIAGVYYEAEIDEESEYASSIKKGFLNKVSIQIQADAQKSEKDNEGNVYTRAFIGEPLEVSVVKVPGYNQSSMEVALAEAFKIVKEDCGQTTANNPGATKVKFSKKEELVGEEFSVHAFTQGLEKETKEHPDLDKNEVAQLVLDHLKENNDYYNTTAESVDEDNKMAEEDKLKQEQAPEEVQEAVEEPVKEEESLSEEAEQPSDMDKLVDVVEALNDRVKSLEEAGTDVEDTVEESNEEDEETKSESESEDEDAVKEDGTEVEDTKEESDTPQTEQDATTTPDVKTDANPQEPGEGDSQNKDGKEDKITKNEAVESEEEPKAEAVEDEESEKESVDGETKEESDESEEDEEEEPKAPIVEKKESMRLANVGYKTTKTENFSSAVSKIF